MSLINPRRGRKRPYTPRGIVRMACTRCKKPSRYQWQACANDGLFMPLCEVCDVALNSLALTFMFPRGRVLVTQLVRRYASKVLK